LESSGCKLSGVGGGLGSAHDGDVKQPKNG
jgi:hypothetical protein